MIGNNSTRNYKRKIRFSENVEIINVYLANIYRDDGKFDES